MAKKIEQKNKPYFPADYDLADVSAIQALCAGTANKDQQIRAISWIVEKVCEFNGLPFFPSEPDCSAFATGKYFVGQQINKLYKLNINSLKEKKDE